MNTNLKWKALAAVALFGLAVAAPVSSFAQSKSKSKASVHRTSTKAKKKVKAKKTTHAMVVVPKAGVMTTGTFRPLKSDGRMTVILPGHPATRADLVAAQNRRTVFTERTVTAGAQNLSMVTKDNFPTTAVIVNSNNTNWWGYNGPSSTSYYDARYGWITTVAYSWGNVMYTYGYQVVNYWNGDGYVWIAYPGNYGVAYPVLYR